MALEDHINLGRPAWSWHANAAADSLAGEAAVAVAVAPYGKDKVNSFILGRAWRLNRWLLPRMKFWLRQQNTVKPPKKQSPGCTKDAFLLLSGKTLLEVMNGILQRRVCAVCAVELSCRNTKV